MYIIESSKITNEVYRKTYDEIIQILIEHRYDYFIYRFANYAGQKNVIILDNRFNTHFTRKEMTEVYHIAKKYHDNDDYLDMLSTYQPLVKR